MNPHDRENFRGLISTRYVLIPGRIWGKSSQIFKSVASNCVVVSLGEVSQNVSAGNYYRENTVFTDVKSRNVSILFH